MDKALKMDIEAAMNNDPAARSKLEVYLTYSGVKALKMHRKAYKLFHKGHKLRARMISQKAKRLTGIEIHPAAQIAPGVFIDHGEGVVIGETAVIETGCVIYQGVTLGGTGKDKGKKRHPTIMHDCMISAGAKVLGGITIHENCKIGAGSVVLDDVPANSTVVGIPGRVIKTNGQRVHDLEQSHEDPLREEILENKKIIEELKQRITKLEEGK